MNSRIPKPSCLAFLSCSLYLLAAGCVFAPLPTSRQPIASRKTNDFEFVKSGQPSRSEVEAKLGRPEEYFPDLRVSVYPVNTVIRPKLWLFLGIVPVHYFRDYDAYDIACIEFNEQDRVQRCAVITGCYGLYTSGLHYAAEDWLATREQERPRH